MNASASRISTRPAQFDANLIHHLRCGGVEVEGKKVNQQHRKWEKMQKVGNSICLVQALRADCGQHSHNF